MYWKCPCGNKIDFEEALKDGMAVEDDELNGCSRDQGFIMTNIFCNKCERVLMVSCEVTREKEEISAKALDGKIVKMPVPESEDGDYRLERKIIEASEIREEDNGESIQ